VSVENLIWQASVDEGIHNGGTMVLNDTVLGGCQKVKSKVCGIDKKSCDVATVHLVLIGAFNFLFARKKAVWLQCLL
jgi:hypothetical protein